MFNERIRYVKEFTDYHTGKKTKKKIKYLRVYVQNRLGKHVFFYLYL